MSFMSVALVFPSVMRVGRHRLKLCHVSECDTSVIPPILFFSLISSVQFSSAAAATTKFKKTHETTQFK